MHATGDLQSIPRFGWLEPWLARGGQPRGEQYAALASQGIRLDVDLRLHADPTDMERCAPRMVPVHIPVHDHRPPDVDQALRWLELLSIAAPRAPVYVHCHHGEGRTATSCALARIAQGWSVDEAIDEQRAFGFDPDAEARQTDFLRAFAAGVDEGRIAVPVLPGARGVS